MRQKEVSVPAREVAHLQVPPLTLLLKILETAPDEGIELIETLGRVTGAEVITPATKHGIQVVHDDAHVVHTVAFPAGQLLHALPPPLDAAHGWLALKEVDATAVPLPDRTAHALVQMAAQKVEPW